MNLLKNAQLMAFAAYTEFESKWTEEYLVMWGKVSILVIDGRNI